MTHNRVHMLRKKLSPQKWLPKRYAKFKVIGCDRWYQRLGLWLMNRVDWSVEVEEPMDRVTTYQTIDEESLYRMVMEAVNEIDLQQMFDGKVSTVYLGRGQWIDLLKELDQLNRFPVKIEIVKGRHQCKLVGLDVVLVPWMDGVLVV